MSCIHFINHRAAQDAQPATKPFDGTRFVHTVNHELVRNVIDFKRRQAEEADDFWVEETKQ